MNPKELYSDIPDGGIDAGLLLLELANPARPLSVREIAFVCGCAKNTIHYIEKKALKKMALELERRGIGKGVL